LDSSWLGIAIPIAAFLLSLGILAATPHRDGHWFPSTVPLCLRLIHGASAVGLIISVAALRRHPIINASDSIGARFNVAAAGFGLAVNAVLFVVLFAAWRIA
jgi:hypothetical protein